MGKFFKMVLIITIEVMKFYNTLSNSFKKLFTNEKSNKQF